MPKKASVFLVARTLSKKARKEVLGKKNLLELSSYRGFPLFWGHLPELSLISTKNLVNVVAFRKYTANRLLKCFLTTFSSISIFLLAHTINLLQVWKPRHANKGKVLMFTLDCGWRKIIDVNGAKAYSDIYYGSLIEELSKQKYGVEAVTIAPLWRIDYLDNIKGAFFRIFKQRQLHLTIEMFWSLRGFHRFADARKRFSLIWDKLKASPKFNSLFSDFDSEKKKVLEKEIGFCFGRHFAVMASMIENVINIINVERPKVIVVLNNGGWYWKSIIIAAKIKGVKVLSLQHAEITDMCVTYFFESPSDGYSPQIPDKTAVYGKWARDLLVSCWNYPFESLEVTGCGRYDFVPKIMGSFDREKFCQSIGADSSKKMVFFAAQLPISPFIEKDMLIMKNLADIPGVEVIIKPHPRGDADKYREITKKIGLKAIVIDQNLLPYEAILASDLVISFPSTIVTEAAMFDKPCVVLDFSREEGQIPFENDGAALRISRENEVREKIEQAIFSEKLRAKMLKSSRSFVKRRILTIDGKATERIASLVHEMLKK